MASNSPPPTPPGPPAKESRRKRFGKAFKKIFRSDRSGAPSPAPSQTGSHTSSIGAGVVAGATTATVVAQPVSSAGFQISQAVSSEGPRNIVPLHQSKGPSHALSRTNSVASATAAPGHAVTNLPTTIAQPISSVDIPIPLQESSSRLGNVLSDGLNAATTALKFVHKSADALPPLKSVVGGLLACVDLVEKVKGNYKDYKKLKEEFETMEKGLRPYQETLTEGDAGEGFRRIVEEINKEIQSMQERLRETSKIKRTINADQDKADIVECQQHIVHLFHRIQTDLGLRTWDTTRKIFENSLLSKLSPVDDARFNSSYAFTVKRRECTPETRTTVLGDLVRWAEDVTGAKIYWMDGMAGTGKTTILYSFCQLLEAHKLLGANFFCSRLSTQCCDVNQIIPTLADQLAHYSPAFRAELCKILEKEPHASKLTIADQFAQLIRNPLQAVKGSMPDNVVVVIDALDECKDGPSMAVFLRLLLADAHSLPVKFFLASRPEALILDTMLASKYSSSVLHLHNIEDSLVLADIRLYLSHELLTADATILNQLEKRAGKLFIYAATIVRYVDPDDPSIDSASRLADILKGDAVSPLQHEELDHLYTMILTAALISTKQKHNEQNNIVQILRIAICAKEPMSVQTLALIVNCTKSEVEFALKPLKSVLHIRDGKEQLVSALHASFPDYLLNQGRSIDFWCNKVDQSGILVDGCFNVMENQLRFNICDLKSSFVFDKDIPNLEQQVEESISAALLYACQYWGYHLVESDFTEERHKRLVVWLQKQVLFWMEVLNLEGKMVSGENILRQAKDWLMAHSQHSSDISDVIDFVVRFVGGSLRQSTPHIYISALPFCPKSSFVQKNYGACAKGLITLMGTIMENREQSAVVQWNAGANVESVAFPPDGSHIISGSHDKTIRVWDVTTGAAVGEPLQGHTNSVTSVAFSPDGSPIISGSRDSTIRVWDATTGAAVGGFCKGTLIQPDQWSFLPMGAT